MKMNTLNFISRHEPTAGQQKVAQLMGYDGLSPLNVSFTDDPVKDLKDIGIYPTVAVFEDDGYGYPVEGTEWEYPTLLAGVFPLSTALTLLRAGFELVVFTNSKDARNASKFICTGADIITLKNTRNLRLTAEEIEACADAAQDSRLFAGSRAVS